ncbi:MAG: ATP-binding cassette domain-containing protein, partial [Chitinivibrionales bacterium]|nr:ATP-binding cassette domain-containing protein [Chitinivibrionales bacterium]
MNLIEFQNVTKTYRKGLRSLKVPAVVDLSFSVENNQIAGFIGPNGAGKTTSLKMLMGLVNPTAGSILIKGKSSGIPASRSDISFVSEQPYFYPHLTVEESLQYYFKISRMTNRSMHREIDRVLKILHLCEKRNKKIKELSKG